MVIHLIAHQSCISRDIQTKRTSPIIVYFSSLHVSVKLTLNFECSK
jgi:hypothetical protein